MFGKAGRADTATDPAPLEMFETTIQFKPRDAMAPRHDAGQARRRARPRSSRCPGSATSGCRRSATASTCSPPASRARSASRSPAPTWRRSTASRRRSSAWSRACPASSSALAERLTGGRYVDVDDRPRRGRALRAQQSPTCRRSSPTAIGGDNVGETVEGLRALSRSTCAIRARCATRCSACASCRFVTAKGAQMLLQDVATHRHRRRPADAAQRERAPLGLDLRRRARPRPALGRAATCRQAVAQQVQLPAGYAVSWSGQFEYLERASERLKVVVPLTLAIIFVLLYLTFRSFGEAALMMATLPFALDRRLLAGVAARPFDSRSRRRSASSPWPASPPSSASSCCCT